MTDMNHVVFVRLHPALVLCFSIDVGLMWGREWRLGGMGGLRDFSSWPATPIRMKYRPVPSENQVIYSHLISSHISRKTIPIVLQAVSISGKMRNGC